MTDPLLPGQPPDAGAGVVDTGAGVPEAAAVGGFAGLAAAVRGSPHAFRVLIAGTAAFCLAISVGMPYETIFVTSKLGVSVAVVGVVWTVSALAGLPLQVVGGVACDRLGRRPLLFTSAVTILIFYAVMALSHSLWPIAAVAILEAMFGWPLYLVACNAMIADLLPMGRRPVAYSVWRGAINVGTVVGPGIAALLLSAGLGYRTLFTVASAGCAVFVAIVVLALPETRPPDAGRTGEGEVGFVRGLGLVAADRRFLLFSGAALLPLLCLGQFLWIFPVYLTDTLGMPASAWAALLAGSAAVVALTGPVVVHLTRRTDKLWLMALSALLMGLGLGLSAFVSSVAAIVPLVLVFALGEALFWPISSAAVSEMAPAQSARHLHGRLDAGRLRRPRGRPADRRGDHGAGGRAAELRGGAGGEPGRGGAVRGAGAALARPQRSSLGPARPNMDYNGPRNRDHAAADPDAPLELPVTADLTQVRRVESLPRLPLEASLDLTYRCNNRCRHCWLWEADTPDVAARELTLAEIRDVVDQARALGCRRWSISGGEPMLRPDFPEIFDYITSKSVGYTLNTNGTLITPEIAQLMRRKGSKLVALYGATAEVNDHITRNPGSFEATMEGFARLKEAGAGFTVQLIPMRDNWHEWDADAGAGEVAEPALARRRAVAVHDRLRLRGAQRGDRAAAARPGRRGGAGSAGLQR